MPKWLIAVLGGIRLLCSGEFFPNFIKHLWLILKLMDVEI